MTLNELIEILNQHPPELKVKKGIGKPPSWRGVYDELAFEIVEDTSVGEMLTAARSAIGETFEGWKGGDFTMDGDTRIHIEQREGEYSDNATLMRWFFELLLGGPDMMESTGRKDVPRLSSLWRHKNGNLYRVMGSANTLSERADYPPMIIYENVESGATWCRKLSDWHKSMTEYRGTED